jgi:transcriptional regulator with XRE-family HTH domain
MSIIGDALYVARRNLGLSRAKMVPRCGLGNGTINRYELGKVIPQPKRLKALSEGYGIPLDKLQLYYMQSVAEKENLQALEEIPEYREAEPSDTVPIKY